MGGEVKFIIKFEARTKKRKRQGGWVVLVTGEFLVPCLCLFFAVSIIYYRGYISYWKRNSMERGERGGGGKGSNWTVFLRLKLEKIFYKYLFVLNDYIIWLIFVFDMDIVD